MIALALLLEATALFAAGFLVLLWLSAPLRFLATFAFLCAAPFVAWTVWNGRWAQGTLRLLQLAAVAVAIAIHMVAAGAALVRAREALDTQASLGTPAWHAGVWCFVAAAACLVLVGLVLALPLRVPRTSLTVGAALLAAAALALTAAAALAASRDSCDQFRLTAAGWREALRAPDPQGVTGDGERIAGAVARCGSLDRASQARVSALLGRPGWRQGRDWFWSVGTTNDFLGPGDGVSLRVSFDRGGRVARVDAEGAD